MWTGLDGIGRPKDLCRARARVDLGLCLEQLAGEMRRQAVARGGEIELARISLRERDQLGHGSGRHGRIHHQDVGLRSDQADRSEIRFRVEIDLLVERGIRGKDGVVAGEQRVAVRRSVGDGLSRDVAACARPVVDHERLAEDLLELAAEDAREHVARPTRREGHDEGHRPRRIIRGGGRHREQSQGDQQVHRSRHRSSHRYTNCTAMPPSAPKSACSVSPFCAKTTRVNEPASTRWPASSATSWVASLLASHANPSAGWPSTPAATPVSSISEFLYMTPPTQRRSTSSGLTGRPPTTMPAAAPLSATVSKILRGSWSRASTISIAGTTYSVARRTLASPTPGPFSGVPRMKASSISTRGRQ